MKTAVVVCPGRGVYNKTELGYLSRFHSGRSEMFARFDAERRRLSQTTLAELDGARTYSVSTHTRGDNASALIFAATLADFLSIDGEAFEIVAVTGNSMGWYSALACAGALSLENGFRVANSMGMLMQQSLIGGQSIYPFVGEDWAVAPEKKASLVALIEDIARRPDCILALSIDLGGMLVVAGNEAGLKSFESAVLPVQARFPLRLANHAGFHSHMQIPVAQKGRESLSATLFTSPRLPLVDGRGAIWWPRAADPQALWDYTLCHQVTETYDFTRAIAVAAREFAPDVFIVTGPGSTLGGAVAQSLILADWRSMKSKNDFQERQRTNPVLISIGIEEQRRQATAASVS
jgi:acyl transferase domain-containing protein